MTQSVDDRRPYYFQPLVGQVANPSSQSVRMAIDLLDIFYMRSGEHAPAELVAIVRCLGGGLEVVTGSAITQLPAELQTQLKTAEINHRHGFRTITAQSLFFFALDASEQVVHADGFNDAIFLHGRLQAEAHADASGVDIISLDTAGRITAGRLDVLHAFRLGAKLAFHHPHSADERVFNLLIPGDTIDTIRQGDGLVLVYPVLDPATFTSIDNTFVVMRIVYDLLGRLQQDMLKGNIQHAFVNAVIPVPSRNRLESELIADGYEIFGEVAIRQEGTSQPAQTADTFLGRLRTLAQQWTAPRIALPPQATPEDYLALVEDVLPAVARATDDAIMREVSMRLTLRTASASISTPITGAAPATQFLPPSPVVPTQPREQIAPSPVPPVSAGPRRPSQPRQEDWSKDFAAPATPSKRRERPVGKKSIVGDTLSPTMTSKADWAADFLAESSSAGMPTVRLNPDEASGSDTSSLGRSSPDPPQQSGGASPRDWADDFD